jgi:hypothetical protein
MEVGTVGRVKADLTTKRVKADLTAKRVKADLTTTIPTHARPGFLEVGLLDSLLRRVWSVMLSQCCAMLF